MIRNFNYRFAGIGGEPFSEIERSVLPRAIKELGQLGLSGRNDAWPRRFFASIRVSTLQLEESEVAFQRYTKMSRFLLSKRKVFVAETPETLTLRQFVDSAPVHDKAPFHRFTAVSSTTKTSETEAHVRKYTYIDVHVHACNLSIMLIIQLFESNSARNFPDKYCSLNTVLYLLSLKVQISWKSCTKIRARDIYSWESRTLKQFQLWRRT